MISKRAKPPGRAWCAGQKLLLLLIPLNFHEFLIMVTRFAFPVNLDVGPSLGIGRETGNNEILKISDENATRSFRQILSVVEFGKLWQAVLRCTRSFLDISGGTLEKTTPPSKWHRSLQDEIKGRRDLSQRGSRSPPLVSLAQLGMCPSAVLGALNLNPSRIS
jgi:hypothetical protein